MPLSDRSDAPSAFPEFVAKWHLSGYLHVATVALLVYDTIITLDKEAKYFWVSIKLPRRPVDFVYFINRYIGIVGAIAPLFPFSFIATLPLSGNVSAWAGSIANWIIITSIDYILMIRVLAFYSQDKTLSICLRTLLAFAAVLKLGMLVYLVIFEHIIVEIVADIDICGQISLPPWQLGMIDWLIPLLYGTLLMILALYKAAEHWRMSSGFKGFTLVKVLIEDHIVYFLLATSCFVFSILQFRVEISNLFLSVVQARLVNPALLSLLGSQMLFNLKEAGEREQNSGTSYRAPSRTMSDMDFAEIVNPQRESTAEHQTA